MIVFGHQRGIEEFREECKIGAVTRNGIHEILGLLHEFVEVGVGAHLPLDQSQTYVRFDGTWSFVFYFVIQIVPFQQNRVIFRVRIAFQVILQDLGRVEIVRHLEIEHRIVNFLPFHLLNVFPGRHLV